MIHATAVVEPGAIIDETAEIGPFCYISGRAKIGAGCKLIARVTILGDTTLGTDNIVFPGACLGAGPQDHGNEFLSEAKLIIGNSNIIRENVTMHAGTPKEEFTTRVGSNGMFMINSHIAHDCVVGDNVIMTNNAVIGGHVRLGDGVIMGGNSAVHQFVRIGRKAMIGGMTGVARDVIPFAMVTGDRGKLRGLNVIGLKRSGYDEHTVKSVTRAYMYIFKSTDGTFEERVEKAESKYHDNAMVLEQIAFIKEAMHSRRQVLVAE
ncbi:MAG: acyl-ACP--UDP-N-acetylglucosamine O-acyltransferase [Alphaproteobacteria bacterium]|nr:acyl-ACP--UDP-N-acetylglucosamine O-acyltransferase [Alphaproteobacteria bacterium]